MRAQTVSTDFHRSVSEGATQFNFPAKAVRFSQIIPAVVVPGIYSGSEYRRPERRLLQGPESADDVDLRVNGHDDLGVWTKHLLRIIKNLL